MSLLQNLKHNVLVLNGDRKLLSFEKKMKPWEGKKVLLREGKTTPDGFGVDFEKKKEKMYYLFQVVYRRDKDVHDREDYRLEMWFVSELENRGGANVAHFHPDLFVKVYESREDGKTVYTTESRKDYITDYQMVLQ